MSGGNQSRPFIDRAPDEYRRPDINPYLVLHREFGPPVVTGEEAEAFRGCWATAFEGPPGPLHVEVGSGNGFFLAGMAARHPGVRFVGIELRFKRVVLCARKIRAAGLQNARIARYDAWWLSQIFAPDEVDALYVHFPDPWSKDRHEKKRMMGPAFAAWAAEALKPGALLRLKTDHLDNVDRLEAALQDGPWELVARVEDTERHGLPWGEDDVVTNYQRKFVERGEPTHALWARRES